jgi:hypothetical protein
MSRIWLLYWFMKITIINFNLISCAYLWLSFYWCILTCSTFCGLLTKFNLWNLKIKWKWKSILSTTSTTTISHRKLYFTIFLFTIKLLANFYIFKFCKAVDESYIICHMLSHFVHWSHTGSLLSKMELVKWIVIKYILNTMFTLCGRHVHWSFVMYANIWRSVVYLKQWFQM